jgi:leucyl-tRNA synthetase
MRASFETAKDTSNQELEVTALGLEKIQKHLEGVQIIKKIVVPNKLVNFVVK